MRTETVPSQKRDYKRCFKAEMAQVKSEQLHGNAKQYEEIDCLINDDMTVIGRREGSEVYFPFSFIQQYFEV